MDAYRNYKDAERNGPIEAEMGLILPGPPYSVNVSL